MQIALCLVVWPHPILPWTVQERHEMTWGGSGALRSCGPHRAWGPDHSQSNRWSRPHTGCWRTPASQPQGRFPRCRTKQSLRFLSPHLHPTKQRINW